MFVARFLILTFIGIRPVEEPYIVVGQIRRLVYFRYYPLHSLLERGWDVMINYLQFRAINHDLTGGSQPMDYDGSGELSWFDLGNK